MAGSVHSTTSRTVVSIPLIASQQPISSANHRSPRYHYWWAFFVFSLIVVGSSIEASDRVHVSQRGISNQKWAVSCAMISFLVSAVVVIFHTSPVGSLIIVGSRPEGIICIVMIILWSALVAVISDVANGLAVDASGSVSFGNLYYFGWAGFVCAIMLLLNFLKSVHSIDAGEELRRTSDRLNLWVGTMVCGLVLMSSAANVFDFYCIEHPTGTKFCNRSMLAILMGSVAAICSIVVIGMKVATGLAPFGLEFLIAIFLFLTNCFSLGLVTAEDGPGAKIGNLYYFSWLTMVLSFLLVASCYEHYDSAVVAAKKELELFEKQDSTIPTMPTIPPYKDDEQQSKFTSMYERKTMDDEGYDRDYTKDAGEKSVYDASVAGGYPSQATGGFYDDPSVASGYPQKSKAGSYYDDDPSVASGYPRKPKAGGYYDDDPSVASGYPQKPKSGRFYDDDPSVASGYPQKSKGGGYYDDDPSVASGYPQKSKTGGYYDDDPSVASGYPQKPKAGGYYDDDPSVASGYPQKPKAGGYYDDDPSVASGYPQKPKAGGYYDDDPSVASGYSRKPMAGGYYDDDPSVASGYPQKPKSGGYYDDDPSVASGYPQKPKAGGYYDDDPSVASGYPQKPKSGRFYDEDP